MSGGVDSSVAAYLLQQQGYSVEGLFMKNWEEDDGTDYCTAKADLADAVQVCERLGITLHQANFAAEDWDSVFEHFLAEYQRCRTPNPDILCNREIKFQQFVNYALTLGGDFIATGHYVRHQDPAADNASERPHRLTILKGKDQAKDQSYFLQAVPAERLAKCLFPLGDWQKTDVRALAQQLGLSNHRKKDSTGICFIGERRFADFLAKYVQDQPGPICDLQGRRLGTHRGLHYYTLGQRQGLNIGGMAGREERPWYVQNKKPNDNMLIITQNEQDLEGRWLQASQPNWLNPVQLPLTCTARIRYRQPDQPCRVFPAANGRLLVKFDSPQRAITPGQYIALYQGDEMLGGACIESAHIQQ